MTAVVMSTIIATAVITIDFIHLLDCKEIMGSRIITFRCPDDILARLDKLAAGYGRTRNTVLLAAVRMFARQLREQNGGMLAPGLPGEMLTRENMFPKPESRGGRPRRKQA